MVLNTPTGKLGVAKDYEPSAITIEEGSIKVIKGGQSINMHLSNGYAIVKIII